MNLSADLAALCARHAIALPIDQPLAVDAPSLPPAGLDLRETVERFENTLIVQALERTRGNKGQAARLLRIHRTTLVEKIKSKLTYSPHFREVYAQLTRNQ